MSEAEETAETAKPKPEGGGKEAASSGEQASAEFRFYVRLKDSAEFGVADFAQLRQLCHSGFLSPEVEVRRAGSEVWRRVDAMPELKSVTESPSWVEGNEFALLSAVLCAATLIIMGILKALS